METPNDSDSYPGSGGGLFVRASWSRQRAVPVLRPARTSWPARRSLARRGSLRYTAIHCLAAVSRARALVVGIKADERDATRTSPICPDCDAPLRVASLSSAAHPPQTPLVDVSLSGALATSPSTRINASRIRDASLAPPMTAAWRLSPRSRHAPGIRVAPGMGAERKVKVLLEPRQTESNTEGRGCPAREVRWKP
jgi:hypothetical protein